MARSTHVYVILDPGATDLARKVVATFTVKRECQCYVEDSKCASKGDWVVRRYRDGTPWSLNEQGVLLDFDRPVHA